MVSLETTYLHFLNLFNSWIHSKQLVLNFYSADRQLLRVLGNTDLQVAIMVSNQEISHIASSQNASDEWVRTKILPFYPKTKFRFLSMGNEVLSYFSDEDKKTWLNLVPAMIRIKRSMNIMDVKKIKVGTPLAMDVLQSSFPPSNGTFRSDISDTVIKPLLSFLNRTRSFFFLDVYPYFPWSSTPSQIHLDYALLRKSNFTYTDPLTQLKYTNLLDQMLDSVNFAMEKLGFGDVRLLISETGWPSSGDIDQVGANVYNAATYNRNLIRKMTSKSSAGTPARPAAVIPTFIFSLYNENQKPGPGTERNFGLLHPNGTRVYDVDLTGKQTESDYDPIPLGTNNAPYRGKIWCVVARDREVSERELGDAISYACGQGNGTCKALQPGKDCYTPVNLVSHSSYAFSSYWKQFRSSGATCYFNGLAVQTTKDPSHGSCKYPSVTV
ncbi:hypothetical protein IFM89_023643 [Coptis chinensis]|uniref:glucan endo-1,3-beta-D-glucosidase n=1 Tax=Coptis chinensis TaxID=261450 RepID=A0A835LS70_9MAGN|nr:hypothetical protein IFM89_023643 [Coptis chinensis]